MTVSKIALAALLASCGAIAFSGDAASAQQPAAAADPLNLSRDERVALIALQRAAAAPDRAAQDAALAAARSVAQGADARYAVANLQFQIGRARGDAQMQAQAADAMIASGVPRGAELASLLSQQASRAFSAGEFQQVDRLLARIVELQPNSAVAVADHAQFKARMGDRAQAVALFQRALQMQGASGQAAPESWYKRALALAYDGQMAPQSIAFARQLVTFYPSPVNWRDALLVYRQSAQPDAEANLDVWRLMRAAQALSGERDYMQFAEALIEADHYGEAKAVLDEGISRGMLDANEAAVRQLNSANNRRATQERSGLGRARTQALAAAQGTAALEAGDAHFGNGDYAAAAELYRAALQKGGIDPNLVNTRLGAALALAGQRAEAEAALRAVTGPRADLAGFWLAWLSRRPAAPQPQ